MHQIIEHLSVGGWWGNMLDVLPQILLQRHVVEQSGFSQESALLTPETIPGFLVSEKERPIVRKYLDGIEQIMHNFIKGEIHEEVKALQKCLTQYLGRV